jgi:hypothetical protein
MESILLSKLKGDVKLIEKSSSGLRTKAARLSLKSSMSLFDLDNLNAPKSYICNKKCSQKSGEQTGEQVV